MVTSVRLAPAPEHRAHPRDELARGERLGHVVVRAELETHHLVDLAVLRGQHDHRHVGPGPQGTAASSLPGSPGSMRSSRTRSAPVRSKALSASRAGRADRDLKALLAQQVRDRVAERFLVLDHEHTCHFDASRDACARGPGARAARQNLSPACELRKGRERVKVEPAPSTLRDCHGAAVRRRHVLHDGKAEAGAPGGPRPGRVHPVERRRSAAGRVRESRYPDPRR